MLSKLGYHVIASTGRMSEADYLKGLGAAEVIDRAELSGPAKPLAKERWAGGIDSVGSTTLANLLSMTKYRRRHRRLRPRRRHGPAVLGGAVYFARRVPSRHRFRDVPDRAAQGRLEPARAAIWIRQNYLKSLMKSALDEVIDAGAKILAGQVRGRIVVKIL